MDTLFSYKVLYPTQWQTQDGAAYFSEEFETYAAAEAFAQERFEHFQKQHPVHIIKMELITTLS